MTSPRPSPHTARRTAYRPSRRLRLLLATAVLAVTGGGLTIDTGVLRQTFDLRPDAQFWTLCAAVGRDYTAAERKLLPEGTPSKPPCA